MGKPIIKNQIEPIKKRIGDIEAGETFLHEGKIYIVSDEDRIVRLNDGYDDEWDEDQLVEPVQITITY